MLPFIQRVSTDALLAVGGVIIFSMCGFFLFTVSFDSNSTVVSLPPELEGKSNFDIGQYYFNHDDDPTGPYDLLLAQQFYMREIVENPKGNNLVWYQSGRIDFINGDFDTALKKFYKQIEYFGDSVPNVYYMMGLTYGYKARQSNSPEDWQRAEDGFKKSISFFTSAPWPYVDLAWVYFSAGEYEEMKKVVKEGMQHESNNPWLLNMYGLALLNTGEKEMAKEYFIFAQEQAQRLTVADWGKSYPGNNPELWEQGLTEFKAALVKNTALAQ